MSTMPRTSRTLTAVAALLLLGMFVFPLWQIQLSAPQYPEGLGMYIHVNTIEGATEFDLEKINNLNHYIGMKPIDAASIPELRFMPWLVGALVAGGLIAALRGTRRAVVTWLVAFALLGVAGLADFWRWGYDYGHDLDAEHAIIKVPGMSYQPPLIGTRQLLNFRASSWPATGGLLAGLSFVLGVAAIVAASRAGRRTAAAGAVVALAACGAHGGAPAMRYDGSETCGYCRMAITDRRFGSALMTQTGRTYRFDSIECLAAFVAQGTAQAATLWVSDYNAPGTLLPAAEARFVRLTGSVGSPMGLGLAAIRADAAPMPGTDATMSWTEVQELVRQERPARDATHAEHAAPEHEPTVPAGGRR